MKSTLMTLTPAIGLASCTRVRVHVAPNAAAQGTGLSFAAGTAGTAVPAAAQAAVVTTAGVRSTDLPGSPPRGAPV